MKQLVKIEISVVWMVMALSLASTQVMKAQNCLTFDGSNDVVHVSDDNTLDLTNKGTIEAWIYINNYVNYAGIVHKGDQSGSMADEAYTLQFGASGFLGSSNSKIVFAVVDNSGYDYVVSNTSLNKNTWYHLAAVWNVNNTYLKLYINGVLDAENTSMSRSARSTSGGLNIGAQTYSPVNYEFDGKIDEVKIWKKSENQSAIRKYMYRDPDPLDEPKLKSFYKFNTGSGSTIYDATSNGNNGTRSGASWSTSTRPTAHEWLGSTSNNWNTASNWFAGWKPNANTPVNISSTPSNQPVVKTNYKKCYDLNIESGATLTINAGKGLSVMGDLVVAGQLIIESNTSQTGSLIDNGNISGTGSMIVKRYIPQSGWHYISSPVAGATSNSLWGSALYSYNSGTGQWESHGPNDTLEILKGYDVYYGNADHTVSFSGTFNTGIYSVSSLSSNSGGYNFVGNPFPSYINWDSDTGWTKTNIDNAIYIWDASIANFTSYVGGVGTNGGTAIIPPTQGFWVKVQSGKTGSLTINNAVRVHSDSTVFRNSELSGIIRMELIGNGRKDETVITIRDNASLGFEIKNDAKKMFSNDINTPQVYSISSEGFELSINSISDPDVSTIIPLGVHIPVKGTYTLQLSGANDNSYSIILEDMYTRQFFPLTGGAYSFESGQGDVSDRFVIHFIEPASLTNGEANITSVNNEVNQESDIELYAYNKQVYIHTNSAWDGASVMIFDLMGHEIMSSEIANEIMKFDFREMPGYYLVKVANNEKIFTQKIFIQ